MQSARLSLQLRKKKKLCRKTRFVLFQRAWHHAWFTVFLKFPVRRVILSPFYRQGSYPTLSMLHNNLGIVYNYMFISDIRVH